MPVKQSSVVSDWYTKKGPVLRLEKTVHKRVWKHCSKTVRLKVWRTDQRPFLTIDKDVSKNWKQALNNFQSNVTMLQHPSIWPPVSSSKQEYGGAGVACGAAAHKSCTRRTLVDVVFLLNGFFKLQLTYNKLHVQLDTFDTCTSVKSSPQTRQQHPQVFPQIPLVIPASTPFLSSLGRQWFAFCH